MNAQSRTLPAALASERSEALDHKPVLVIRKGRGRLGGSTILDLMTQRARHAGRRVKPLDGDLRSRTLATLYPAVALDGSPIVDGASVPVSEELPAMKAWLLQALDDMVVDRLSRVLDLGGGDRVIQEFVRDLSLVTYCSDFGIDLMSVYLLGPDLEDFRHVTELVRAGDIKGERTMLVLNEGVIRLGQSVEGVFEPIVQSADMRALMKGGARVVYFKRLTCMDNVRLSGLGYYDVASGVADQKGVRPRATLQHMVKVWLQKNEDEHATSGTLEWLP